MDSQEHRTTGAADARQVADSLPEAQRRDFLRLARELQAHQGRWGLFVLEYEHARTRERMAGAIEALVPGAVRLTADDALHPDWPALEAALLQAGADAGLVQLLGLEQWLDPYAFKGRSEARLRAWNVRREAFAQAMAVPVLCWMRAPQVELLATAAPDLWSWRAGVHWFERDAPEKSAFSVSKLSPPESFVEEIDNRLLENRLSRIQELTHYIQNTATETPLRASLLSELADLHASIGNFDEALRIRLDLAPALQRLGETSSWAALMARISDLLLIKGRPNEALTILRDQVLPVFEALRDTRLSLVTLDRIADILQIQGKLEEALQFRLEFQLPLDEALGDMHARAITLSKIADIYQSRKELDEALRIEREEVLPTFEKLGDLQAQGATWRGIANILRDKGEIAEALAILHNKAVPIFKKLGATQAQATTMSGIADLLQLQGELDEALRIRREEVLPVHEKTGNARELIMAQTKLAINLFMRGHESDRPEISRLLNRAFLEATEIGLPEAAEISRWHQRIFGTSLPAEASAPVPAQT